MKSITEFLLEQLENDKNILNEEKTITSEKEFREAAEAKFKEVFGDELDEDEMNETIEGLLKDNSELVEKGEWGELIGMLNKSFAN